tara:strand:+ start:290 stop:1387 length:1098 start_codon:yes stop_codon:yes gene_type:complete
MTEEINKVVAAVAAPKTSRKYNQREAIYETKFSFTDKNMVRVKHRQKLSHDRRYDEKIKGLAIEVYPNHITFFVFKNINMYNKKKNAWAPNVVYKKMFVWAKNTGFNCVAAREKAAQYLDQLTDTRTKADKEITVEYLVKKFIKTGLNGFTLKDDSRMYKEEVKKRYISNLEHYVLYEGCLDQTRKKHTAPIEYMNTIYSKPLKSYIASELTDDAIKAHKFKLKDTPQVYNTIATLLSVVYNWAKMNKIYKGDNPFYFVKRYPKVRVKVKLPDDVRDKIKDYCESKAFDYNAHFLTIVATVLYTGFRGNEIYGLRWTEPKTEEEKKKCSGWLPKDENFNKPIINKVKSLNLKAKSKGLIVKKKKK